MPEGREGSGKRDLYTECGDHFMTRPRYKSTRNIERGGEKQARCEAEGGRGGSRMELKEVLGGPEHEVTSSGVRVSSPTRARKSACVEWRFSGRIWG